MLITEIDIINPKGSIHVGAHKGEEKGWYTAKGFRKVLWFEPNADIFRELQENIKGHVGHKAINNGLSDKLRTAKLNIASNSQCSSTLELGLHKEYYPKIHYTHSQAVIMMRGDEIPDLQDYNFLNIDVQGDELSVIKSFGPKISLFHYIYSEVNFAELYKGCSLVREIDKYLSGFGFTRTRTEETECEWGDALYQKL